MKTSLLIILFSFGHIYAGTSRDIWQFGNIKSWNKKSVKVSLVTNKDLSVSKKWFKDFKIYENQPVRIIYRNKIRRKTRFEYCFWRLFEIVVGDCLLPTTRIFYN